MRAVNRHLDRQRDQAGAALEQATNHANDNPNDATAQAVANDASATALAARRIADEARYNR